MIQTISISENSKTDYEHNVIEANSDSSFFVDDTCRLVAAKRGNELLTLGGNTLLWIKRRTTIIHLEFWLKELSVGFFFWGGDNGLYSSFQNYIRCILSEISWNVGTLRKLTYFLI